ncbi:MAG: hypothetical protein IPH58_16215 [Sphingobacteriales bacterium]|nr:hypothetical protein [Sphingobacteriales bacterium]
MLNFFNDFIINTKGSDYITTGGTSGKPLGFYIDKNRKGFEWFWMNHNWSKIGMSMKDYKGTLTNHKLNGKKFNIDTLIKEYQYDNFSLNDSYINFVVNHINSLKLKYFRAYPSAAFTICKYLEKQNIKTTLRAFLCGSENILSQQKQLIQDTLKIRMYTWYGHSEKLILAGEETSCENYHSNPFYGYTEIIDDNGNVIKEPGAVGELVGTGFINTKMPFIRYRTGDYAEYVGDSCKNCGHIGLTFRKVKGRWQGDKIHKSDGSSITTTALNLHSKYYNYIKGLQYYQEKLGEIELRIIPETNLTSDLKDEILRELSIKAGKGLKIKLIEVEFLELSAINKFQLLIQKLKLSS